jgi:hypothetical protein
MASVFVDEERSKGMVCIFCLFKDFVLYVKLAILLQYFMG